jgi:riboflavin kinase/FMN adenylyltransferase
VRNKGVEIVGTVVPGDQRGRTIGYPTANLALVPGIPVPRHGVYAALADGRPAAVNVGTRPTFDGATPGGLIEVHVIDFEGDLYGREMRVTLLRRLRGEQRFDGPDALVTQLARDVERVREITGFVHEARL